MIACHCFSLRSDEIRTEVRLGAVTLEVIAQRCGATTDCGGCANAVLDVVEDELERANAASSVR